MEVYHQSHQYNRTDAREHPPIRLETRLEGACVEDRQYELPLLNGQSGGAGCDRPLQAGELLCIVLYIGDG
jgi:hypothetical protein